MSPSPAAINSDGFSFEAGFPKSFSLTAGKDTDIYAAPKHGYVWTAPVLYYQLPDSSKFQRARVTVSFNWIHTFDQAGLVLAYPSDSNSTPDAQNAGTKESHPQWVKAGIEVNDGIPQVSVVARDVWADWSLSTMPQGTEGSGNSVTATIEFEKYGNALKVFIHEGLTKRMVRKVQWVFDEPQKGKGIWIGVYAARPDPTKEAAGGLDVKFNGFEVVLE